MAQQLTNSSIKAELATGQSGHANPDLGREDNRQRVLSSEEKQTLLESFSQSDNNESLRIRDFLDAKLASHPSQSSDNEIDISQFNLDPDSSDIDSDSKEPKY